MAQKAKAIGFRVVILPDSVEKTTASGIIISVDDRLEKNAQVVGTILDIGEDAFAAYKPKTEFCGLKVGDKVFYAKYAGKWLPGEFEGLLVVNDDDIVAKVENVAT